VTKTYDGASQLNTVKDWLGGTFTFGYDPNGNLTNQADPNGVTATTTFDNADQPTAITDAKAATTLASFTYTRDNLGQVTGNTPTGVPGGPETYGYTKLNQLATVNTAGYGYDKADNLIKLADGTSQTFDAANELTTSTPPAVASVGTDQVVSADQKTAAGKITSPTVKTTKPNELILAFVSADGPQTGPQRITKVTGGGLTWTLASRSNGALGTAEVWQAHAATTITDKITATLAVAGYDGSITIATFTGAAATVGATGTGSGTTGAPTATLTTTINTRVVWAAGHAWTHSAAVTPVIGQSLVHQYRDTRVRDTYWTQKAPTTPRAGTKVTIADTTPTKDRWELAAVEITPAGTGTGAAATNYTYDTQGNRTASTPAGGAATTLGYDQANRLTNYGTTASYTYNGDGTRTSKTVSGTATAFVYDPNGALPLLLADGTDYYLYGPDGQPLEKITGTTPTYLHHDQQGSTRLLTDTTGTIIGTYTYDPYGKPTAHTGTATSSLQYNGQYTDTETGYQYLRTRYYDPATAQFITADPAMALSGARYSYSAANPLTFSDPSGLLFNLAAAGFGAVVGAFAGAAVNTGAYLLTCGNDCSIKGTGIAAVTGAVGGALTGACVGFTVGIALTACSTIGGAVAGAASEGATELLSGKPLDWGSIGLAGVIGGVGGRLGLPKSLQPVGRKPTNLSNFGWRKLLDPHSNTYRIVWGDVTGDIYGAAGTYLFQPTPAC
jgi:RHS repeat-associated protein